jgi:hypothetical protein
MKKVVLLLFSFCFLPQLFSQTITQTLRGTVLDKQSGEPLIGATVVLLNSEPLLGTSTDANGQFRLANVPIGRQSLRITYLGYKEAVIPDIVLNSGKEMVLNIGLEENVVSAKEVIVSAGKEKDKPLNDMATVSSRVFTIEETNRYAGSLNDPSRMASNFAGVVGANDQRNDIIIRGNSPLGLLWRVEGIDIPSPNHFSAQGANGGPVSILNNNILANSDFMTGAFPAEYGNANSGAFDLKIRTGNNEKHEFMVQMGFNGAEVMAEGPFSKKHKSSYLVSFRYSTLGLFKAMGLNIGTASTPEYQDLSFKLNFPGTKLGNFTVFGIGGTSHIKLEANRKGDDDQSFGLGDREDVDFGGGMGIAGISNTVQINKHSYIKTTIATSIEGRRVNVDSLSVTDAPFRIYEENSNQYRSSAHIVYNNKLNARSSLRTGIIANRYDMKIFDRFYNTQLQNMEQLRDFTGETYLMQGYFQFKHNFTSSLTLNTGLHYLQLLLNNTNSIEPRAGLKWSFKPGRSLNAGYGVHGQMQPMYVYLKESIYNGTVYRTNEDLGFTRSQHFVLGYDHSFTSFLRLKAETYFQHLSKVPVEANYSSGYSLLNFGADFTGIPIADSLTNKGTGENYGVELTLEKFFSKKYYFLFTTSLFKAEYKGSDGISRNSAFNSNYVVNLLGGMEFDLGKSKNKTLSLDGKVTVAGGKWYTPIDLDQSIAAGEMRFDHSRPFSQRYRDYFRADLKVFFKINMKKYVLEYGINVQNIFDTKNILMFSYDSERKTLRQEYQLGIFPVPQFRIIF